MQGIKEMSVLNMLVNQLSDRGVVLLNRLTRYMVMKSKNIMKTMVYQVGFLVRFSYSKENIINHLYDKASRFFGLDTENKKPKKKRKRKSIFSANTYNPIDKGVNDTPNNAVEKIINKSTTFITVFKNGKGFSDWSETDKFYKVSY